MMGSEKGMALVLTLLILALITALVVEFSYGVYTTTAGINNWKESQRLSFIARSGVSLTLKTLADIGGNAAKFSRLNGVAIPIENVVDGFTGTLAVKVEDENGKFNLNSLRKPIGGKNPETIDSFKRLLNALNLSETIAERITDWIDKDSEPLLSDSEEGAKNDYLDSVDELLLIRGITREAFEKLSPFVTVLDVNGNYKTDSLVININTASVPVIMSFPGMTKSAAEEIVRKRELAPFDDRTKGSLGAAFSGKVVTEPSVLRLTAIAEDNKIKRVIECVVLKSSFTVRYWREQ